jgi:2-keto-3-deoxy-6-phosphogluconate aldolase
MIDMNRSEQVFRLMKRNRLVALLSPKRAEDCITVYEILAPLGVVLEIAFRTPSALDGIKAIVQKHPDGLILAGTVLTSKQAESAIHAGASAVVSPDYLPSVVACCVEHDVMCVPGGLGDVGKQLTYKAECYRCEFEELFIKHPYQWIHKLYPAVAGNLEFAGLAAAWKGPFKDLSVMYTGGLSSTNIDRIFSVDPEGIVCGSAMTASIDDPNQMIDEARKWLSRIDQTNHK